jgi:hypothetical protein
VRGSTGQVLTQKNLHGASGGLLDREMQYLFELTGFEIVVEYSGSVRLQRRSTLIREKSDKRLSPPVCRLFGRRLFLDLTRAIGLDLQWFWARGRPRRNTRAVSMLRTVTARGAR